MTTKLRSVDGWDGAHVAMVILQGLGDVYSGGLWQLGILCYFDLSPWRDKH